MKVEAHFISHPESHFFPNPHSTLTSLVGLVHIHPFKKSEYLTVQIELAVFNSMNCILLIVLLHDTYQVHHKYLANELNIVQLTEISGVKNHFQDAVSRELVVGGDQEHRL